MATTKSTSITNLDAAPPQYPTAGGGGGAARLRSIMDTVHITTGVATSDVFRIVRIPTHATVKQVLFTSSASATTLAADVDVFYSDNAPFDGSSTANSGVVQVSSADNKLFGAAFDFHTAQTQADLTYKNTTNFPVATGAVTPLWSLLGLSSDPGGYFDIGLTMTGAGTVTAGDVMLEVRFTDSY